LTVALVWLLKKRRPFGAVTGWYLVLYGVWRFFIEFYRSDDRGAVGALSTSQFIAIFMVAAGVALLILIWRGRLSRRTLPEEEEAIAAEEEAVGEALENSAAAAAADNAPDAPAAKFSGTAGRKAAPENTDADAPAAVPESDGEEGPDGGK
ncbi:MAG: prolipoprotein diacylglyceryl transferase, partial [Clostridia bacterium]|nr:prolipoprotein diacylglyceryl transferase [Clostridia bacterium]